MFETFVCLGCIALVLLLAEVGLRASVRAARASCAQYLNMRQNGTSFCRLVNRVVHDDAVTDAQKVAAIRQYIALQEEEVEMLFEEHPAPKRRIQTEVSANA